MTLKSMKVGLSVNRWLLGISLFMIFSGAVIASKFDSWYAVVSGAILAVVGCYLNQSSIKWVTEERDKK